MESIATGTVPSDTAPSNNLWVTHVRTSTWVIVGYSFWFGFFLGALIMHSIIKSV